MLGHCSDLLSLQLRAAHLKELLIACDFHSDPVGKKALSCAHARIVERRRPGRFEGSSLCERSRSRGNGGDGRLSPVAHTLNANPASVDCHERLRATPRMMLVSDPDPPPARAPEDCSDRLFRSIFKPLFLLIKKRWLGNLDSKQH